jgi:hypothetical protein
MNIDDLKKKLPYSEIEQGYSNCALANERVRGYNDAIDYLHAKGLLMVWNEDMGAAPRDGTTLLLWNEDYPYGAGVGYYSEVYEKFMVGKNHQPTKWALLPQPKGDA